MLNCIRATTSNKAFGFSFKQAQKIQEMTKAFNKSNLQGAIAFLQQNFGGFSQHSRKMFELTKAAKLADAAIN